MFPLPYISGRAEALSELLASIRRQGVRAENILKDGDNLLQRYRNLEARLQQQAAAQSVLEEEYNRFKAQTESTRTWISDLSQPLMSPGKDTDVEEMKQKTLDLRQQWQSICENQGSDSNKRTEICDAIRHAEEQWQNIMQAAKLTVEQVASQAASEREFEAFKNLDKSFQSWIKKQRQKLLGLGDHMQFEERWQTVQAVISSKAEGESKLLDLKMQTAGLSKHLEKSRTTEMEQLVAHTEQLWGAVLQTARQAELRSLLDDFDCQSKNTESWIREKQQKLQCVGSHTPPQERCHTAQVNNLRRRGQTLCDHQDADEGRKVQVQQTVKETEKQWRDVLQGAQQVEATAAAEIAQESERRKLEHDTDCWLEGLQQQLVSLGNQAKPDHRLHAAQNILSLKPEADSKLTELTRQSQNLSEQEEISEHTRRESQKAAQDSEQLWGIVLQTAENTLVRAEVQYLLSREMEAFRNHAGSTKNWIEDLQKQADSMQCGTQGSKAQLEERMNTAQQDKAEARLAEIQKQTSNLPQIFPWPGLGERRQAVEQARTLLDQSTALAPLLLDVRSQDVVANLEQGIVKERQCSLLIEQHEAAQDWLREQVKGLGPPPADRHSLRNAVNTLKALLQTVDREQREMMELEAAKDCLLSLCTPGGQDAITLEVSHLHELCANSKQEVRERLTTCKRRLEEMDCELAQISQGLKERAAALQWELRSLDQAFKTEPMPIVRISASRDVSAAVQPATVGTSSLEFNETEKELESGRTTDQEVHELFPTTRSKSLHRPKEALQQTVTQSSERDLDTASKVQFSSSSDPTDAPNIADYIENLWKNTDKIEKRYLILDVPDRAICQTFDIDLKQPDKESEGKNDSNRLCSSVCAIAMSQEGRAGLTKINFSEDENVKLRGTGSEQEVSEHGTSQEKSKELEESDVHEVKHIREERSAQREPSCILPLDIATTPEVTDNTCVTGNGPNKEPAEANIQDGITKQISSEAKPSASESVLDHKTEFVEISFYEQDQIHQIETKMANKYSIPDEHSTLLTHMGDPKSVTLENSPMLTEVVTPINIYCQHYPHMILTRYLKTEVQLRRIISYHKQRLGKTSRKQYRKDLEICPKI
ncbi:hypothetical protein GOODEAATRI_006646 [Goodea atripinnis]|uniref:Uncharacterized protein n=1 Tax=Goodea atripinnis TaxID=208336 RepID=A0ABV0P559_9TELE